MKRVRSSARAHSHTKRSGSGRRDSDTSNAEQGEGGLGGAADSPERKRIADSGSSEARRNPLLAQALRGIDGSGEILGESNEGLLDQAPLRSQHRQGGDQQVAGGGNVTFPKAALARQEVEGKFQKRLRLVAPHLRRVLYRPAKDSPYVAGTDIPEANVIELLRVLRQRMSQPAMKGAKLASRIVEQLTLERAPGPVTVEGVKIVQLKRLANLVRPIEVFTEGAGARGRAPWVSSP